ncbi:hypothetical protein GQ43DRAFT_407172 [Delitschia confertaspora ATCC 74209]|uniref:MOSC domain-containing protein n=1 Tax=Delitschia confertaspora ATCC 74209 TaxID=1513339 RepID=A0A9P4JUS9_9PLEO|nr:hypothetical protein GQ43DRAFT_407172 [Delitschia confertaspora ATCC 74209]
MALSNTSQAAIITTAFFLPLITYFVYNRPQPARGPLPPPTPIIDLYIYPIKSCHGISVPKARLLPTGLDLDRQWMWVTYPDFKFLTIRNLAKMTLIRPSYDAESDLLTVRAPRGGEGLSEASEIENEETIGFEIPAHPTQEWLQENCTIVDATVWRTTTPAYCYPTTLTAPFNDFFGKEVRLVYKPPVSESPRALVGNGSKEMLGREASTCFADLMPVLVGCESSIEELKNRVIKAEGENGAEKLAFDVRRFRPNILVRGYEPWAEDRWLKIRLSSPSNQEKGFDLDVVARCARCHVPNVDPETGKAHKRQPWDTLMKYRRVDPGINFKPCFGMLCVPAEGGEVEVGGKLEVVEMTDGHRYIAGM